MKRGFVRVMSGVLSLIMFMVTAFNYSYVSYAANEEVEGAVEVTASSVILVRDGVKLDITDSTTIKDKDKLELKFAWKTVDYKYNPPITFKQDLSSQLKNISLANQVIYAEDATYRIEGQTLYIDIEKGSAGRSGFCTLSGEMDLSNAEIGSDGKTVVQFLDKIISVKVHSDTPDLNVYKHASGACYKEGDVYYQDYLIDIHNYSVVPVTGITLTDTFTNADNLFASGAALEKFKINGGAESTQPLNSAITLPDIPAGDKVQISYRVKVDITKALAKKDGGNKAVVAFNDVKKESWAYPNISVPSISKGGTLSADGKTINWTIRVTSGDIAGDSDFFVVDSSEHIPATTIATALGLTASDGKVSIPKAKFISDGNGTYTLNYSTKVPDEYLNKITATNINNKAVATFTINENNYNYDATGSVYIAGVPLDLIDKSVDSVNYESGEIIWKVTINVPADPKVTAIKLRDNNWGSTSNSTPSYFDVATFASAIRVDGQPITNQIATIESGNSIYQFAMTFAPEYIAGKLGGKIEVTYPTYMDKNVDMYADKKYINNASVDVTFENGETRYEGAQAIVSKKFTAEKVKRGLFAAGTPTNKNTLGWVIRLKSNSYTYTADDVITVTDTLPEGYRIIKGSQYCGFYGYDANGLKDQYNAAPISYTESIVNDVQTVTFTVDVNGSYFSQSILTLLNSGNHLHIAFDTEMTDEYYNKFNTMHGTGTNVEIVNNAVIEAGDEKISVSGSQTIIPNTDKIVNKSVSAEQNKVLNNVGVHVPNGTFDADYSITVNEAKADILEGGDELILKDKLGTYLDIDTETIVVNPPVPEEDISYDKVDRTLTIKLKDETAYTITYKVLGYCADIKDTAGDTGIDNAFVDRMYGNTVELFGNNSIRFYKNVMIEDSTYDSSAGYGYSMRLSGTKAWFEQAHAYLIPKTVTINIKKTAVSPSGVRSESIVEVKKEVKPDADGSWTYYHEGLTAMGQDGTRYEYEIEEIMVGGDGFDESGYAVNYSDVAVDNDKNLIINFKNEFVAHKTDIGSIKVTKKWEGSTASHPAVTFVVTNDQTGDKWEKTLNSGEEIVVFTELPLCSYSRDSVTDKLVRTPYTYSIKEIAVDGYTTTYSVGGVTTAADANGVIALGNLSKDSVVEVDVTNKKIGSSTPVVTKPVTLGPSLTTRPTAAPTTSGSGDTENTTSKSFGTTPHITYPSYTAPIVTTTPAQSTTPVATAGTTPAVVTTAKPVVTTKPVITTATEVVTNDKGETVTNDEGKPVTTVVTNEVIVTEIVTKEDGKPVTDDKGAPVTTEVTEMVTVTQIVTNDDGDPVIDDDGKPVTTAVTTLVTDKEGNPVTNEQGKPVTSVVTESVIVTSKVVRDTSTTTKAPDVTTTKKETVTSKTEVDNDIPDHDSDISYETDSNPGTSISITAPAFMTILFGAVAVFSGKKKRK